MIMDRLYNAALESPVCVGLDTKPEFLPDCILQKDWSMGEKIAVFNQHVVDATADLAGCYKVQVACYEALGLQGMAAYARTVQYVRNQGKIVIGDCKRGDISSTASQYALGHFEGDFEVDLLTVNAYMGEDAVSPYYPFLKNKDKGIFVLLHTSNPSSRDFQEKKLEDGRMLYEAVADRITKWGADTVGQSGFSAVGAVVGLTYPEEFEALQKRCPSTFFLVPGYGAQGGTGKDIAEIFKRSRCAVINSSRGILCGKNGNSDGPEFVDNIRGRTAAMKEDILRWL